MLLLIFLFVSFSYWTVHKQPSGSLLLEYGLEAKVGDSTWLGFGVSRNQSQYEMMLSDVTIAGVETDGSAGFAIDYAVTALQTCQELAGGYVGVCPVGTEQESRAPHRQGRYICASCRGTQVAHKAS